MAYTINEGYQQARELDKVQRGLLIGLPALAVLLGFGALINRNPSNTATGINPKIIPIVSSLTHSQDGDKSHSGGPKINSGNGGSSAAGGTGVGVAQGSALPANYTAVSPAAGGSYTAPIIGGRGGGPVGGGGGSGGYTTPISGGTGGTPSAGGGTTSGGILPVNGSVYIPPVNVQAGDKSLANTSGTTLNLN